MREVRELWMRGVSEIALMNVKRIRMATKATLADRYSPVKAAENQLM
jgi:hypothetical protein